MSITPFEPKFMKVGVLTAALQELTPREVRDPDPDRAIEEWLDFARELGATTSSSRRRCTRPSPTCRRRRCSTRWPTRSTCASRSTRSAPGASKRRSSRPASGISDIGYFDNMLHHDPAHPQEEARLHAARVRRGGAARRRRGLRLRRAATSSAAWTRTSSTSRAWFVPLLKEAKDARAHLPRRAVPDARLDDERQLAQQHRLHARHLDRAAPHLREARRRRPVPHPLRSVARDPDGSGHAVDLPVPEGRGLQLPDRRLPREGPGHRRRRASPPGATAARPWSAATGSAASRRRTRPIS